ncbi:Hypothetical protein ACGLYG10_2863 [Actinomyces glycerinitolerans]|uniref:Uncharacterized protein n=1 Tax=Actinomyces glycerinitolerans TaxID=1892869 RepID=A0A1M4S311_9ACTO|nr:Hypothetical protein ACGLYG10_2863 [Actinomyces glycerinitolerans]
MTTANPLVAERQDSTSFWAGTGIGEDLSDLSEAIGNGSWVYGSLAGVALAGDVVFTVFNPIAAAVSAGLGWLIEHIHPLDEMLEQLTGDADAVMAGAQTWTNISEALATHAQDVRNYVTADMAGQAGLAAAAWRSRAKELSDGLDGASGAASGIAKGLQIAAAIVQFVHDMVRDTITEAFGMLIQAAAEEFFSLGLLTPLVAYQTYSWIATRVTRLSGKIKDLVTSISALSRLLNRVPPGLTGMVGKLKKLKKLAPSNLAEATGRGIGRGIKNHLPGSPKAPAHAGAARAARSANNLDSLGGSTTSTPAPAGDTAGSVGGPGGADAAGGRSSASSGTGSTTAGGGAHAGSGSGGTAGGVGAAGGTASGGSSAGGGSDALFHGIHPTRGDMSAEAPPAHGAASSSGGTGQASAPSSPDGAAGGGGVGAGGSSSGSPGSAGGAGTPSTYSDAASSAGNNSYHGINPIHGDTSTSPSAHGTAHADVGSGADTQRAGSSGSEGAHTSTPDATTGRAGGGGSGAGGSRADAGEPEPASRNGSDADAKPRGRSGADGDPGSNRPADHNSEQHQPDEHGKQAPDERPRDTDSPGSSERPSGHEAEPESVSAHMDPEGNSSHSSTAAADSTAPHGKADDAPDPASGGHKDAPSSDTDTTHKSNDGDTSNDHAKDNTADHDSQHEGDDDHNVDDHADVDGADGADGDVDDRYQKSVPELFEDREGFVSQRDELLGQLDDSMPDGLERKAFNIKNRDDTVDSLLADGYDPEEIKKLQKISTDLTAARQNVSETSAAIGEVGGQHYSDTHGAPVLDAWRNENNGHTPPGGYSDGAALSGDGKTFYELEYKGVTARLSKTPVHTTFEGDFPQGTPEYARDHLITDPRYAQYFHDHKDVWEAIKSGKTSLCFRTISTRTAHGEPHVQDVLFDLVGDGPNGHKVRDTLQEMIDALD